MRENLFKGNPFNNKAVLLLKLLILKFLFNLKAVKQIKQNRKQQISQQEQSKQLLRINNITITKSQLNTLKIHKLVDLGLLGRDSLSSKHQTKEDALFLQIYLRWLES